MALHETAQSSRIFKFAGVLVGLVGVTLGALGPTSALAQSQLSDCGPLHVPGQYGPYDYRTDQDKTPIVLQYHFTPEVEALVRGSTGTLGGDIAYTLGAIPNYPRALIAMMRLGEKEKTPQPNGSRYSVECWFDRAIRFRPDDAIVRMIYSTYLNKQGRRADAIKELNTAETYAKDNAFTHYNLGLHYFDLKDYDQALAEAHKAIALGFGQTALRDKLQAIGKWTGPAGATGRVEPGAGPSGKTE